jgi:hypothetical protein
LKDAIAAGFEYCDFIARKSVAGKWYAHEIRLPSARLQIIRADKWAPSQRRQIVKFDAGLKSRHPSGLRPTSRDTCKPLSEANYAPFFNFIAALSQQNSVAR